MALAGAAHAETTAAIAPAFSPDRLGSTGSLTFTFRLSGPGGGVPTPVRHSILRFPAGLELVVPQLRSCGPARLRARGVGGCPAQSVLGRGSALVEANEGSQTVTEEVSLWLILGPLHNIQPTVEVLGQGYTPFDQRTVLVGTMLAAGGPYGESLTLSIPPISTLPLEPDASIVAFSLTIGADTPRTAGKTAGQRDDQAANTVRLPHVCPPGGFPFAAEFLYADGSSGSASATVPCP
jgi:hypothetical protein